MSREDRDRYLRRTYGITEGEYALLLDAHEGGCWICGRKPKKGGRRLHVEHDHKTGRVRGLACWKCNQGLQTYRDDPAKLRAAADYLESTLATDIIEGARSA
jgi:hypothetical protein